MNFCKYLINPLVFLFSLVAVGASEKPYYCGFGPFYEDLFYQIVKQNELLPNPTLQLFAHCPDSALCWDEIESEEIDQNLVEWQTFLGPAFSSAEVEALIYQKDAAWYENILKNSAKTNETLAKKLLDKQLKNFAEYMILAKSCENITSNSYSGYGWYQGEREEQEDKKPELLETAVTFFRNEKNRFLKNRYAFQMLRLAHYLQENEAAINYFDNYMQLTPETTYIWHRGLEQRSGAAYNLQQLNDAALGFIKVYAALPERRRSCALSLNFMKYHDLQILDDVEGKKLNEILHFFRAFHGKGKLSEEMKAIEALNPNSVYLETLAVREMDKIQKRVFEKHHYHQFYDYYSEENFSVSEDFEKLVTRNAEAVELENQDFWKIIAGITALAQNEVPEAKSYFSGIANNSKFYFQAKRLNFAADVFQLQTVDRQRINELFLKLKNDKELYAHVELAAYFFNQVSKLYVKEGNVLAGHFVFMENYYTSSNFENWEEVVSQLGTNPNMYWKYEYVEEDIIARFEEFLNLKNKTDYEELILSQVQPEPYDYLYELKGTYFLSINKRQEAISTFKKIKNPKNFYSENYRPHIFSAAIHEKFYKPFSEQSDAFHEKYPEVFQQDLPRYKALYTGENEESYQDNKLKLAQALQRLVEMTVKDPNNAADYYYMLGNAWYNMSEEGWFLNTLHYVTNNSRNQILGYNYGYEEREREQSQFHYWANLYYRKALESKGSKETKAKATFMLAKTNSCFYFEEGRYSKVEVCGEHLNYFQDLKENFSETEFEKEVIKECSWYRAFLGI